MVSVVEPLERVMAQRNPDLAFFRPALGYQLRLMVLHEFSTILG